MMSSLSRTLPPSAVRRPARTLDVKLVLELACFTLYLAGGLLAASLLPSRSAAPAPPPVPRSAKLRMVTISVADMAPLSVMCATDADSLDTDTLVVYKADFDQVVTSLECKVLVD